MEISSTSSLGSGSTNSTTSLAKLSENLDNFLTILTTQLQHQDPLSPMDTHEFTNQLVQFASVEQGIQSNKNLESLIGLQETNIVVGAVSFMGKNVEVLGQTTKLENGSAEFFYTLPENASAAILAIFDENGTQVRFEQANTAAGRHSYIWDGTNDKGQTLPDGNYTIQVVGTNADGDQITPTYSVRGAVSGVAVDGGVPTLNLDGLDVPLANVVRIIEPEGEQG
jgi:flagellar basal-body rod modification protein FlgD